MSFDQLAQVATAVGKYLKYPVAGILIMLAIILYSTSLSYLTYNILFLLFGFFTTGFVPSFSIVREQHSARYSGSALGFMNMANSFGPFLAPTAVGLLMDTIWNGTLIDSQRVYSLNNYKTALLIGPVCLILALFILPLIKETYCKTADQREPKTT